MRSSQLDVVDWRRQVTALYRDVRVAADPATAHSTWCATRERLIATHPASPRVGAVARHAPYHPGWRFEVVLERAEQQRIEVATGTDGVVPFERIGRVALPGVGDLDVWWLASYGGGVWLPLRDSSPQTYGGGRYLLDTVKGADLGSEGGRLVIDLNFAYNPSCAYDEAWACPLAPPGNVVDLELPAGELLPG